MLCLCYTFQIAQFYWHLFMDRCHLYYVLAKVRPKYLSRIYFWHKYLLEQIWYHVLLYRPKYLKNHALFTYGNSLRIISKFKQSSNYGYVQLHFKLNLILYLELKDKTRILLNHLRTILRLWFFIYQSLKPFVFSYPLIQEPAELTHTWEYNTFCNEGCVELSWPIQ